MYTVKDKYGIPIIKGMIVTCTETEADAGLYDKIDKVLCPIIAEKQYEVIATIAQPFARNYDTITFRELNSKRINKYLANRFVVLRCNNVASGW